LEVKQNELDELTARAKAMEEEMSLSQLKQDAGNIV
jgi:hypothetical protein